MLIAGRSLALVCDVTDWFRQGVIVRLVSMLSAMQAAVAVHYVQFSQIVLVVKSQAVGLSRTSKPDKASMKSPKRVTLEEGLQ